MSLPSRRSVSGPCIQSRTLPRISTGLCRNAPWRSMYVSVCGEPSSQRPGRRSRWRARRPSSPRRTSSAGRSSTRGTRTAGSSDPPRAASPRRGRRRRHRRGSAHVRAAEGRARSRRRARLRRARGARPSPGACERSTAGGSVSTRSTVTPRRWNHFRIVVRAWGTAKAAIDRHRQDRACDRDRRAPRERPAVEPREHGRGHVGLGRILELSAEQMQALLELAHSASSPSSSRRRASARARRDLTVPRLTPSAAAVSSSESSRK